MALDFPNAPSDGQEYEGFVFSSATGAWRVRRDPALIPVTYLVIGGGAGGGYALNWQGGGGGAGGYRCNVPGETSGGNSPAEPPMALALGTYSLIVGAGATGVTTRYDVAPPGGTSKFASVLALGGGTAATLDYVAGYSGGGAVISSAANREGGIGIPFMNSAGGDAFNTNAQNSAAGGGGGASAAGGTPATQTGAAGAGGAGIASSITGSSVTRAGGGAGGSYYTGGTGGVGGGGDGASITAVGTAGTANTGGGGGGSASRTAALQAGSDGGSGVVIFSVLTGTGITFSGGVTQTSATVGSNTVYTVTATATTSETFTIG